MGLLKGRIMRTLFPLSQWFIIAGLFFPLPGMVWSQNTPLIRKTIAFQDPARPVVVKASVIAGSLVVKGYEGKEVLVEAFAPGQSPANHEPASDPERYRPARDLLQTGLTIKEEDNVVTLSLLPVAPPMEIRIQVPMTARLKLRSLASGEIRVEKVNGEIETDIVNGNTVLTQVSGAVVAHAVNGNINVDYTTTTPDKPMAFTSVNGNIQLAFPARLKARVKLESMTGHVACDFEIQQLQARGQPAMGEGPEKKRLPPGPPARTITGTINGGGPEITVKTVNGSIQIRKKASSLSDGP
jgi:hypothetical protein